MFKKFKINLMKYFNTLFKFAKNAALLLGSGLLFLMILAIILAASLRPFAYPEISAKMLYEGTQEEVAYVRLSGEILAAADNSIFGYTSFAITPLRVRQLFDYLAERDNIKVVVVEVNSPGGSVAASEEVYQQMSSLAQQKPLLVYMSEVAASGGYYISLPAEKIIASVPTITGSIGVIAFDPDLSGLYEKLGVQITTYQTGPYKDLGSINRPSSPEEVEIFESIIDDSYQLFLDRVEQHRALTREQAEELADGRIYSGQQAQENGLIDEVGNLDTVFAMAEERGELVDPSIVEYAYGGAGLASLLGANNLNILPNTMLEGQLKPKLGLHYLWVQ